MSSKVEAVMTRDIVSVLSDTPFKECVAMVVRHGVGALPVLDEAGCLLGILSESDLLCKEEANGDVRGRARSAGEAMTRATVSVRAATTVAEAARVMHESSVRHLLVTEPNGRLVGILARADLLKVFLRSDESVRREIDEDLLPRTFGIAPGTLEIEVHQGVVHVGGEVETSSQTRLVLGFVERVEGVVAVQGTIHHRLNDTPVRQPAAVD